MNLFEKKKLRDIYTFVRQYGPQLYLNYEGTVQKRGD